MDRNELQRLPKIELHLHLEGAIPLAALWTLLEKYGGDPTVPDLAALERRFAFRDFAHFIRTWVWKNNYLREYDDFTYIADAVAESLVAQRVIYAEITYSPGDFARHGLDLGRLTQSIRKGLDRHADRLSVRLIPDMIRDFGPELGKRWLAEAHEVQGLGLVAIGLGGSEPEFPPEAYADIFAEARRLGFRTTAHAGEAAGPASIWGAIRFLRVDRVGHGTQAFQDPTLVPYLKERGIAVEACPISNVRTGVVRSLAEHPINRFLEEGICVSVNTDDPAMFHTSLDAEFLALEETFAFGYPEVLKLTRNAIDSAFCDSSLKEKLRRTVEHEFGTVMSLGLIPEFQHGGRRVGN